MVKSRGMFKSMYIFLNSIDARKCKISRYNTDNIYCRIGVDGIYGLEWLKIIGFRKDGERENSIN